MTYVPTIFLRVIATAREREREREKEREKERAQSLLSEEKHVFNEVS